jgi:N-acetylglucosaminyl-diphospho-decaprenol L-rhamnosyltransferase
VSNVAVVTIAHGRHDHLLRQHRALGTGDRVPDEWVLVAMDDPDLAEWPEVEGLTPHVVPVVRAGSGLPLAVARNAGARRALELDADVLVFLDVDCLPAPELVTGYADVVGENPGTVWSGPVTYLGPGLTEEQLLRPWTFDSPHPARPSPGPGEVVRGGDPRLFWSLSFALSSQVWRRVGGFHEGYVGYGGEDTDFGFTLREAGVELGWVGGARAYHQHHPVSSPPVEHVEDILRNAAVFHERWGVWPMQGWLDQFEAMGLVRRTESGWALRRSA